MIVGLLQAIEDKRISFYYLRGRILQYDSATRVITAAEEHKRENLQYKAIIKQLELVIAIKSVGISSSNSKTGRLSGKEEYNDNDLHWSHWKTDK